MQDKQVYSSARSEEIKRQVKTYLKVLKEGLRQYREKRKKAKKAKEAEVKPVQESSLKKTRPQNIQITSASVNPPKEAQSKITEKPTKEKLTIKIQEETLYKIFTYLILIFIVLIIGFAIYMTNFSGSR